MRKEDLLKWFDELAASKPGPNQILDEAGLSELAVQWSTDAISAISTAFPRDHEIMRKWAAADQQKPEKGARGIAAWEVLRAKFNSYAGIWAAAHNQLKNGRIDSFIDSVRAATEDDLLEQADWLLAEGLNGAATVIAGGALEVHLRRLCEKNELPIQGHGAIDKYNAAIAEARNRGLTIYEKADSSQVTAWGQLRNEAAHKPDQFKRTADEVRSMIAGIRGFIARIR